jgi:hypothetical protein
MKPRGDAHLPNFGIPGFAERGLVSTELIGRT